MAERAAGRTSRAASSGKDTVTATVATATDQPTSATARPTSSTPDDAVQPVAAPVAPEPSPRTGVLVNATTVVVAFATGDASQSVGYVQHVLRSRGFEPGNVAGVADHATRVAYARFQDSIGEPPTGLPTASSLEFLGFDAVD